MAISTTLDAGRHYDDSGAIGPLSLIVLGFEVDFRERNGQQVQAEKVILGKIGDAQYRQEMWISRLSGERSDDPRLWAELVKPAYEAWKAGEELVHEGTPLAVLGFIAPRVIQTYRMLNIHTVESLAAATDADLARMGLQGRQHRDLAAKYVAAASSETAKIVAEQRSQAETIARQAAELEELKAMLRERGGKERKAA